MRYVSVFSGVEAATLAWHQLGWEPVAFSEIDPFPSARPDKEHALKPLEEAAEVFGAWQLMRDTTDAGLNPKHEMAYLMDEIADTIQACCNLAAALGVTDLTPYLARCEERNRHRGRYGR